jgi:arylsulfatase A-like enzyme
MNHSFVHVRDVMPTILDVAGAEYTQEIGGRSVVPMHGGSLLDLLSGVADKPYPGASQVGYELFGMKAFFDGDWKILWMPPPFGTGEWELYNLREDPAELAALNSQYPERLERMIAQWEQYKDENGVLDVSLSLSGDH